MRSRDRTITELCPCCDHSDPLPPSKDNELVIDEIAAFEQEFGLEEEEFDRDYFKAVESAPKGPDVSGLLGQKLLQGWMMMQEVCPYECRGVPLMKSRTGQLLCVSCNRSPDEPVAEIQPVPKVVSAPTPQPAQATTSQPTQAAPSQRIPEPVVMRAATPKPLPEVRVVGQSNSMSYVTETLQSKLHHLASKLQKQKNTEEIKQTCQAIEAAARALSAVKSV